MGRAQRPSWLTHRVRQGQPHVFSVDLQNTQDNPRIATCGCDGIVRIWFLRSLAYAEHEPLDKEQERCLDSNKVEETSSNEHTTDKKDVPMLPEKALASSLSYHTRSVNMVRWSPQGHLLASAGDDFLVFIYHKEEGIGYSPFGSKEPTPMENWRGYKLAGHSNDVLGIAWSPCEDKLASCSVDNTIIIWNVRSSSILTRLQGHESFVKGLSFDPTGRFLASHGEDLAVLIWKTSEWRVEKELREPFKESRTVEVVSKKSVLQIGLVPCGRELVCSNCLATHQDKRVHAAVLFRRERNFDKPEYFRASAPILCVRYSRRMYKTRKDEQVSVGNEAFTAIALGTASGTLVVWISKSSKAFLVLKNACDGPILDISWSPDGYSLIAASAIGPPLYFHFTEEELGYHLTIEEEEKVFEDVRSKLGANYENVPLTQSTIQLEMERLYANNMQEGNLRTIQPAYSQQYIDKEKRSVADPPQQQQQQQMEYNVGKKRRIVPKCLSAAIPQENSGQNAFMTTTEINHHQESVVTSIDVPGSGHGGIVTDSRFLNGNSIANLEHIQNVPHGSDIVWSKMQTRRDSSSEGPNGSVHNFRKKLESYTPTLGEAWLFHSEKTMESSSSNKLPAFSMEWTKCRIIDERKQVSLRVDNDELYCYSKDKILWQAALGKGAKPIALAGEENTLYAAVTCNNPLHLFSIYSSRLYAPIRLNASPHMLEVMQGYVFVILINGELSLYRIPKVRLVLRTSVWPILSSEVSEEMLNPIFYPPPLVSKNEDICLTLYNG
eukprot:jgi/Galph1/5366/GphlegSOOS_G4013.1